MCSLCKGSKVRRSFSEKRKARGLERKKRKGGIRPQTGQGGGGGVGGGKEAKMRGRISPETKGSGKPRRSLKA